MYGPNLPVCYLHMTLFVISQRYSASAYGQLAE